MLASLSQKTSRKSPTRKARLEVESLEGRALMSTLAGLAGPTPTVWAPVRGDHVTLQGGKPGGVDMDCPPTVQVTAVAVERIFADYSPSSSGTRGL